MAEVVPPNLSVGDFALGLPHSALEVLAKPLAGPRGAVPYFQGALEYRRAAVLVLLEHEDAERRGGVRVAILLRSRRLSDDLVVIGGVVAILGLIGLLGFQFDRSIGSNPLQRRR